MRMLTKLIGWSLWSKDILFVITTDSTAGPQAWVDAYHGQHDPAYVEDLPIKGGALQGALALDYTAGTSGHRFDKIHVIYDGINGQLPNLDLFNSVVHIAKDHMGIGCTVQRMWSHADSYKNRLQTILNGMISQGLGSASGPHSSFIPYHVDAVTLQTIGDGWHDEMSLGRVVESTFRSLNNLLEHLHQSFFFYLLTEAQRFTSIGTYLPAAMLIAANFSISAITLWVHSGRRTVPDQKIIKTPDSKSQKQGMEVLEHEGATTLIPHEMAETAERNLFTPLALLFTAHALGVIPLYLFNNASSSVSSSLRPQKHPTPKTNTKHLVHNTNIPPNHPPHAHPPPSPIAHPPHPHPSHATPTNNNPPLSDLPPPPWDRPLNSLDIELQSRSHHRVTGIPAQLPERLRAPL